MTQKTFDAQTAKFLAIVSENMPSLTGEEMQTWIQNPSALGRILDFSLQEPSFERGQLAKLKKPFWPHIEFTDDELVGDDGFLKRAIIDLHFRLEPNIAGSASARTQIRPWLGFSDGDLKQDLYVEAEHRFPDLEKFRLSFDSDKVMHAIFTRGSLTHLLEQLEEGYITKFVEYAEQNLEKRLSAKREGTRWKLELKLLDKKAAWFSTTFYVSDAQWSDHCEVAA